MEIPSGEWQINFGIRRNASLAVWQAGRVKPAIPHGRGISMPVSEVQEGRLIEASQTGFSAEGLRERQDIQRMLRDNITILGENLFVLSDEYGGWIDSNRRIDLLCIDTDANIVVVELKRDDSGHMELQAIRYAAMIAQMTFNQAVDAHGQYLCRCGHTGGRSHGSHSLSRVI